ncbi:MAG: glutamine-hydrolyzing GMP synthase [Candidatus Omnitrophica bacterium CG12_big_fil_rev_8_21_14_0_65_43_15]|uniref:GMP synthase [glutamine-hydrolyzing] n=1 Tax=Candidatus Taenaricola geysiri TaxID=1974752 RepID=A0A2J0LGP6_9BACT|nr:MAG: glutamine-hydrolyzing GMP synthase [Candidatus Omnitrophica bacterium CG10_big_fil_rev_8_21_14_0_10_43_8]PIW67001.1 MAG: glutamine-hydrolyzing GMP synthase [Candidatus Omnitrophica bacterium CG12_big_fil_rev_8_21_14_0_65_43_15]PIW80034.1 MAG: glutamine-hydrolyzing GMP synthase [Candidatus Omnitrophica bacterium CG_4_8_14_3_um_filter_43_15]PIY84415.1 MAG: glutamine-hydrolyzing GMP synthase [Candidatus Omnitrophica bacterium CG_4_10_14_0_8_um_filter_43_18]PJC46300.1 MAG: glutamine-hydroly
MNKESILIIDFGSQYNQLIARRVRENNVFCRLVSPDISLQAIEKLNPKGIILSGGPASVYQKNAPRCDTRIFVLGIPVLGICYGMQFMAHMLNGNVTRAKKREYGRAELSIDDNKDLFKGLPRHIVSWMSHGDHISKLPKGFMGLAYTKNTKAASFADRKRKFYGVQFHPEVAHTQYGKKILENFLFDICGCSGNWTMKSYIKESIQNIKNTVGNEKVVLGLSGGVDSSVAAVLLNKAIGKRLRCIFVDNGLLRKGEREKVKEVFGRHFKMNLKCVDAAGQFLRNLKGETDPEKKRKIIGKTFIKVFEKEAKAIGGVKFLAQGTLYPDVIESRSAFGGPSATIKTHHNVGGLPKKMNLKLVEPLKELFKDEVRQLGKELGMLDELVWRQPFPGPGLAVRIIGDVTRERLDILKEVDYIVIDEIKKAGFYRKLWQAFAVFLPVKSVGIMGDERTYENVAAIRAVTSQDAMTADWAKLPYELLGKISNRIINEVKGINRVVYDISSKPPSTIEWE